MYGRGRGYGRRGRMFGYFGRGRRGGRWGRRGGGWRGGYGWMGRGWFANEYWYPPRLPYFGRQEYNPKAEEIYNLLPKQDCGACGYPSCYDCAIAIAEGYAPPDACRVSGQKIKKDVEKILRR